MKAAKRNLKPAAAPACENDALLRKIRFYQGRLGSAFDDRAHIRARRIVERILRRRLAAGILQSSYGWLAPASADMLGSRALRIRLESKARPDRIAVCYLTVSFDSIAYDLPSIACLLARQAQLRLLYPAGEAGVAEYAAAQRCSLFEARADLAVGAGVLRGLLHVGFTRSEILALAALTDWVDPSLPRR